MTISQSLMRAGLSLQPRGDALKFIDRLLVRTMTKTAVGWPKTFAFPLLQS